MRLPQWSLCNLMLLHIWDAPQKQSLMEVVGSTGLDIDATPGLRSGSTLESHPPQNGKLKNSERQEVDILFQIERGRLKTVVLQK